MCYVNNNLSKFVTKKNVGGSFAFEAYNSKEYTDGILFSINQDGQYKVNHVLGNKWGKAAVLATKDDIGNIATHSVSKVSGTTSNTKGGTITLKYPEGYTLSNCVVMAYKVEGVVNGFENRIQLIQNSSGINVYTNHDSLVSKPITLWLYL